MLKVNVILVNWNGKQYLNDCLTSLFNQHYDNFEIILVDNKSTDGSVDFIKKNFPEVKILALDKNYGFAKGNNIGINEALKDNKVQYVALLNNDTIVAPNWLTELIKAAESDSIIGSCQSKMLSLVDPNIIDAVGISITKEGGAIQVGYGTKDMGQYNQIKEVFGACAGAVLYRREMLIQIGLFDEDFFSYSEDVDLALRARLAGWKCIYVPKAIVYHKGSGTGGNSFPKLYLMDRNRYYYIIKNLPYDIILRFLMLQVIEIIRITLSIIKRLILKDIDTARISASRLKAHFHAIKNIHKKLKERSKIRNAAQVPDEKLRKWFN